MKKTLAFLLLALPMGLTLTSCSDDDEQPGGDTTVVINQDGTASGGHIFSAVDATNFYLDYIKYSVVEGHLVVSGYDKTGFKGAANIVSKITVNGNTYEVLGIGDYAFYGCSGLTSVTIPSSVTSIGRCAFKDCRGLTKAEFASIGRLCSISFSDGTSNPLTYARHLYIDGKEVTDLVIPESVTSIRSYAFSGCSGLTSVNIPNSVTSIGDAAFYYCSGLTSVTIPNSVTSIGRYAFWLCSGLTSVTIPNSVTSIGYAAFEDCRGLTKAEFASIGKLCSISFSDGTSNPLCYAHHLYIDGKEVTDLVIPESVTSIGDYTFYYCSGLTSVTIPSSVTSIGDYAFSQCKSLTSVTIPSSVTSIGRSAFEGCSGLTSVIIPNSVTSIGRYAFWLCSGLTSVTIPNSVTYIGDWAFTGCSGLTSVTIPSSVTSIGYGAFSGCSGLTSIHCKSATPPDASFSFDSSTYSSATLYVPKGSLSAYQSPSEWSRFKNIVEE